jgi:inosose dehydratase
LPAQSAPASAISLASAPVSWGIMEDCELPKEYPYGRVLDEIAAAGFTGTELGPYGYLPSAPDDLRRELSKRGLQLCSAFIAIALGEPAALKAGLQQVRRTAELIAAAGATMLILSDEITPERSAVAGRREAANKLSWSRDQWKAAIDAVHAVAEAAAAFKLGVAFHHHVGCHVETPEEVEQLLASTPPSDLSLCLDTGHYAYGGGDPVELVRKHGARVRWLHFKDVDPDRLAQARAAKLDFHQGVRSGVFAPLGQGVVDWPRLLALLAQNGYHGWAVVEQDVLPGGAGVQSPLANASAARKVLRTLGL